MSAAGRADAMAARVLRSAERAGVGPEGRGLVDRCCRVALDARDHLDDRHPDRLHPARTALILAEDAAVDDPLVIAAGTLVETRDPVLAVGAEASASLPSEVSAVAAAVPRPDEHGDMLLEALLVAAPPAVLIALAERLDHARHLHLRDAAEWRPYHETTCAVYRPLARRTHRTLHRRFAWWCDMFRRRFLGA